MDVRAQIGRSSGRSNPPQFSIDLWNTTIQDKFHIEKNVHIPMADVL